MGTLYALLCPLPHTSLGRTHLDQSLMATLNSTISGSNTGDTLIGTESDQLILGGTAADSIGSQYSSSSLVGSDGNDTFFANSKVPGVGEGSTMRGGSGADSFEFNSYGLTRVELSGNSDNDSIRLTGPTVETSIWVVRVKTAFNCGIPSQVPMFTATVVTTLLMSLRLF